jgi:hypothetical protein
MVIKQKCSSRNKNKNKTKLKTNTKTKKSKESLRVSSFSAVSECSSLSGGGKIKKSRNHQIKTRKTKLKKYRLRKSLHLPDDMIYVLQEVPNSSTIQEA